MNWKYLFAGILLLFIAYIIYKMLSKKGAEISFIDYLGEGITQKQTKLLTEYGCVFKENGKVKKIEHFSNHKLTYIDYYLTENESIEDVLKEFVNIKVCINIEEYKDENYLINHMETYENTELKFIEKALYKYCNDLIMYKHENVLCFQEYDIKDRTPILKGTEKTLIVGNENVLGFEYKEDGSINYIWGDWVCNTDQRHKGSIYLDKIDIYFPNLLNDHPYYINANLYPSDFKL